MYPILSRPGRVVVVVRARLKKCDYLDGPNFSASHCRAELHIFVECPSCGAYWMRKKIRVPAELRNMLGRNSCAVCIKNTSCPGQRCQKQRGAYHVVIIKHLSMWLDMLTMTVRGRREWNREMISNQLRLRAVLRDYLIVMMVPSELRSMLFELKTHHVSDKRCQKQCRAYHIDLIMKYLSG